MEKADLEYILMALEYALHGPVKDDDHETHFNLFANAIEVVKNEISTKSECIIHSTDWTGKCFNCGEQVFLRQT